MKKIIIALMITLMIPIALAADTFRVTFDENIENEENCEWMTYNSGDMTTFSTSGSFKQLEDYHRSCGIDFYGTTAYTRCLTFGDIPNTRPGCGSNLLCTSGGCAGYQLDWISGGGDHFFNINTTTMGYESINILSSTRFLIDCQINANGTDSIWGMGFVGFKDDTPQFWLPFAGARRPDLDKDFPVWEMGESSCIHQNNTYSYNFSRSEMEGFFGNKTVDWTGIDRIAVYRYASGSSTYLGAAWLDNIEITGFQGNTPTTKNKYPYFTSLNISKTTGTEDTLLQEVTESTYQDNIVIGVNEYLTIEAYLTDPEGDTIEWGVDYDSARDSKPDCFDGDTVCGLYSGNTLQLSFPTTAGRTIRVFSNDDSAERDETESYNTFYRTVSVIQGTCGIPVLNLSIDGDTSQFEGYPQYIVRDEQNVTFEYNGTSSTHGTQTFGTCPTIALWRKRDSGSWILLQNNSDGGYYLDTSGIPDGTYKFRVQGYNGSYSTPLDTSADIEIDDEYVGYTNLLTPCESGAETFYTHNQTSINFTWEETAGSNVVYDLYASPYNALDYRLIAGNITDLNYTWTAFTSFPTTDLLRFQLISRRNTSSSGTQDDSGYVCSLLDDGSNIPVNITSISAYPTILSSPGTSTITTYWTDTEGENISYAIDCLGANSPPISFVSYTSDNPIEVPCGYSYNGEFMGKIFLTDQTHGESYLSHADFYVNQTGGTARTSRLQFLVRDINSFSGIEGATITIEEIGYTNTTGAGGFHTVYDLLPQAYFVEFNHPDYWEYEAYFTSSEIGYTIELTSRSVERTVVNLLVLDALTNLAVEGVLIIVENPITFEYATAFSDSNGEATLYDLGGASFVNYELTKIDYADSTGSFAVISFTEQNYTLYIDQYITTIENVTSVREGIECQDFIRGVWLCGIDKTRCDEDTDCISNSCNIAGFCSTFNYTWCDVNGKTRNLRCVMSATFNGFMSSMTDWMLDNFLWMLILIILLLALTSVIVMMRSRSRS